MKISPALLAYTGIAVMAVFITLAFYAHPSSDDYCMAAGIRQHGLAGYLWSHYFEWSGRYAGNALYGIYPMLAGFFEGYAYFPLLLLALLVFSTAFFLSSLFRIWIFDRSVLLISLCFTSVYLLCLLSPASSLYWLAGAMTYQPANALLLVAAGLMLRLRDRQAASMPSMALFALLALVMVFAMGLNETGMLVLLALALYAFLAHVRYDMPVLRPWIIVFVITLLCLGIVVFAPGNAVRASDFPMRHDLLRSITGSLDVGGRVIGTWLGNPVLITASLLAPFAAARLDRVSQRSFAVKKRHIAGLALCAFTLPVLLQFPAWWSMGGWPPPRTQDAVLFVFLLFGSAAIGAATLYVLGRRTGRASKASAVLTAAALLLATIAFIAAAISSQNLQQARHDLASRAAPWSDYMEQRYGQIRAAVENDLGRLVVPDYDGEYPHSIYFNDIMTDPTHWRNACYAEYFGLDEIRRGGSRR